MARMAVLPPWQVIGSTPVTPRMRRIRVGGPGLVEPRDPVPARHVRLLFGEPGAREIALPVAGSTGLAWPERATRPHARSMTVRHRGADFLDIDVALHHATPATRWAADARPGDPVGVVGPGGGYLPPADARHHLLVADESGLPALATIVASLPASAQVTVIAEVADAAEEYDLACPSRRVTWCHRSRGEDMTGAVHAWSAPRRGRVAAWVAGEGHVVKELREHLRIERGLERSHCHAIRYWTRGRTHEDSDATFTAARREAARRGIELRTTQDVHELSYELMTGGFALPT